MIDIGSTFNIDNHPVFDVIEKDFSKHVEYLQEAIRQPSVSSENIGVRQMGELLVNRIKSMGGECKLIETGGFPIVYGKFNANAKKTVLFYELYDVQPATDEGWIVPPFSGEIMDFGDKGKSVIGRGAFNSKGCVIGFLNVIESFIKSGSKLPVNIIFMIEGEEEIGSIHLPDFINSYKDELKKADCVYQPYFGENSAGKTIINLGFKGLLYIELTCKGGEWGGPSERDIHPLHSGWIDGVPWRLIQALNTFINKDGELCIDGLEEKIEPPSKEELLVFERLENTFDPNSVLYDQGVKRFKWQDISNKELLWRNLRKVSINIDGIYSGYTGEGAKTIMPREAKAKLDIRLMPKIDPMEVVDAIRNNLDKNGYKDIDIKVYNAYPASHTHPPEPSVLALINSAKKYAKGEVEVWPRYPGAAPHYLFSEVLGLPTAFGGLGHGGRSHSTNEYVTLEGFKKHEYGIASFLLEFGEEL